MARFDGVTSEVGFASHLASGRCYCYRSGWRVSVSGPGATCEGGRHDAISDARIRVGGVADPHWHGDTPGLIGADGAPTELYRCYRNPAQSEQAMAQAIRQGYPELERRNEYAHVLNPLEDRPVWQRQLLLDGSCSLMKNTLVKVGVGLVVLALMYGLLVLVGQTGQMGEPELLIWLALLIAAERFALRWVGRRRKHVTAP